MKILLVVNSDIGKGYTIGFRFGKIAQELKNRKIDFSILARANYSDFKVKTPFYKNYLARFFNALRIYLFPFLDFRKFDVLFFDRFVLRQLKKMRDEFDLVHFGEYLPGSIKYLKDGGAKIFLDIPIGHHKYAQYLEKQGFKLDNEVGEVPLYLDKAIELADVIVAPSEFVRDTLEMAGFSNKKIKIIPFGVDLPNNFSILDIENRPLKPLRFIFSGNVNYRKGVNFLLEAWDKARLKDAELIFCGRVYKKMRKEVGKYKKENIIFLGQVNAKKYMRDANIFILPSLLEGSAKSVYEAMSFGLPSISTFNAGSIIENGKTGFIIPIGDPDLLSEKMKYFYQNHDEIIAMGINAFQDVKKYTWENYGQKIVAMYLD
jgi:glycosyltransferase involved in cell wall biosynthesis